MSKMIRLKNMKNRTFSCDLEKKKIQTNRTRRIERNAKSGTVVEKIAEFSSYETLTILPKQTTEPFPESILENASIQAATTKKKGEASWLKILPVIE